MTARAQGVLLAFATALISGVAVYVNSHGVTRFSDATVYTTAKNGVAGVVLVGLALPFLVGRNRLVPRSRPRAQWLGVAAIAIVGGSVPFVLFFEGLARAEATQAAFIHKTLVIWVALLAVPLLGERLGAPHVLAIGLLIAGQAWLAGDLGTVAFGAGEAMIFAATLLWSVEVILVKRLVGPLGSRPLAAARMALGTLILAGWLGVTDRLGDLFALSADQWSWALLTGSLLAGYVATWYAALARAQAVDVTAVLVFAAVVTAVLARVADGASLDALGLAVITLGTAVAMLAALRAGPRPRPA